MNDPDDQSIVYAIRSTDGHIKGIREALSEDVAQVVGAKKAEAVIRGLAVGN